MHDHDYQKKKEQSEVMASSIATALILNSSQDPSIISSNQDSSIVNKSVFPCTVKTCQAYFSTKNELEEHARNHKSGGVFQCEECEKYYSNKRSLKRHTTLIHSDKAAFAFNCKICSQTFAWKWALDNHSRSHNKDNVYQCNFCSYSSIQKGHLKRHLNSVHNIRDMAENDIENLDSSASDTDINLDYELDDHQFASGIYTIHDLFPNISCIDELEKQDEDDNPSKINTTSPNIDDQTIMEESNATPSTSATDVLSIKNLFSPSEINLLRRIVLNKLTPNDKKLILSDIFIFKIKKFHTQLNPSLNFSTFLIEEAFSNIATSLDKEELLLENPSSSIKLGEKGLYHCMIEGCKKTYKNKRELVSHNRDHSTEKPFICIICSNSFKNSQDLSYHRKSKHEPKKHICNICSKSFVKPSQLKLHMYIHSGEKRFKCSLCDYQSNRNDQMKKHISKQHFDTNE